MKLILFLTLICGAWADYDCLCNYDVERSVYPSQSDNSSQIGYLYEFDCKQTVQAQQLLAGWKSVAFEHKVGYVKEDDKTNIQVCNGDPPATDTVSTAQLQVPSENITTTIPTTISIEVSQEQTTTTTVATKVAATTAAPPTNPTTIPTTTVTGSSMAPSSTTTVSTMARPMATSSASVLSNNSTHICPQSVYNSTMTDNATLIINQIEKKCYEFVQSHQTWSNAEANCQKNGGHLVTVRNLNENNELYAYVKAYGHSTWLGLNDKNMEDKFTWVSEPYRYPLGAGTRLSRCKTINGRTTIGRRGENNSYTNWRSGHHDFLFHGSEDCVSMLPSTGHWEDLSCTRHYAYICEYASIPDVSGNSATQTPMTTDGSVHLCPLSDVFAARTDPDTMLGQYGDSCYVLTNGSHVTWTSAESTCKRNGGHLAHIKNADEQNFIVSFLNRHSSLLATWIGLSDTKHEGQFQWSTGEAVTYTNWITGFNGTDHVSEDCVVLLPNQTGKWDEVYCSSHGGGSIFFPGPTERHQMLCQYKTQTHASSILIG